MANADAPSFTFPPLGLGGAGIGNLYRAVAEDEAIGAVQAALRQGMGLIDTAPYYGHGLSELRIGRALRDWEGERPILSTKVGRVLDPATGADAGDFGFAEPLSYRPRFDYSRAGVRRSLEGSMERLGADRVDIALIHDVGHATHGAEHESVLRQVLDDALPELEAAREEGLIRLIGLGVNEWQVCMEVLDRAPLDCILLAGRYTLLEQPALTSGMLDRCRRSGVHVLAAGVFNSGLLAEPPSARSTYNYAPVPAPTLERAQRLWSACESFGVPPQAAALQFSGAHPAVATVVAGARSVAEVDDLARWSAVAIPHALWTKLRREGFIAPDAPVPGGTDG